MLQKILKYLTIIPIVFLSCSSSRGHNPEDSGANVFANSNESGEDGDFGSSSSSVALKTIVIDAGHGGVDGGAQGKYSKEKEVTLAVALKLRKELQARLPYTKIVMTRTTDITQNVRKKADIANQAKGDLFISIHCNSASSQAAGTETYIWGITKNDDKTLAMRENESLGKESADFKPNDPQKKMYYSLKTRRYFSRSLSLAVNIEKEFTKIGRTSREARQRTKGIWVLQATAMPSVLVETGFISNPKEEKYLNSTYGQNQIAICIAKAVVDYNKALMKSSQNTNTQKTKTGSKKTKNRKPKAVMK